MSAAAILDYLKSAHAAIEYEPGMSGLYPGRRILIGAHTEVCVIDDLVTLDCYSENEVTIVTLNLAHPDSLDRLDSILIQNGIVYRNRYYGKRGPNLGRDPS